MNPKISLFQQRDFGTKINATFQYVTQNIRSLGLALLYIVTPVALIAGIATGYMQVNFISLSQRFPSSGGSVDPFGQAMRVFSGFLSPAFWIAMFFSLITALFVTLVCYTHMKLYARKTEQNPTATGPVDIPVGEVWQEMQSEMGRVIVIGILGSIITGVATLFFVIPGIYVGVVLSLGIVITTFEGTDFGATWNRCFLLIRDKWWSTAGIILVMSIIAAIISYVFAIPAGIIGFLFGAKQLSAGGDFNFWLVLTTTIATVGGTLLRSLVYIAIGFQYANLVERLEGRGMLSAIDSIGTPPSQPRAAEEGDY